MSRASSDTATRKVITAIVAGVGVFAGADSYSHIYSLARDSGQDILSAALLPLAGDGLIAAASGVMLVASRQGRKIPLRAHVMLYAGILATVAANLAYGLAHGRTDGLLSIWPVACYVGAMELLTWIRAHTDAKPKRAASASAATPPAASASASPAASPDASDDLRDRRERRADADLLTAAEDAWPDGASKLPSLRTIQTTLSVGQPKAQLVQAHFNQLARAAR